MLTGPVKLGGGLLDAAGHFQKAQKKLTSGALKDARFETLAGVAAAERARAGLRADSPLYDLTRLAPKVEAVLGEADHFVAAALRSSEAVQGTLDIAQNALRGPDKIIGKDPEDDKGGALIRIDRIKEIARTVSDIRDDIVGVKDELGKVKVQRIPGRFRAQVRDGISQAEETDQVLQQAEAGLAILPGFLGEDEPRTYLFGMQNSAEQRGTGGAMLQFALLSIANGAPELLPASTVYDVDENRDPVSLPLPPDAWYVAGIPDAQRFGNANWSPDWPLSADLTVDYAQASEPTFPEQIDGVFAVTPVAMQKLMPGVGPYRIPTGNRISAGKIVHFVLYKAYGAFPIPKVRRARLREVVDGFYERMLRPDHPSELVKGFGESLAEKHLQVWMADPAEQRFVEMMEWDGALRPAAGSDYLYVVEQNVGGNKLDYFDDQVTRYDVSIGDDGQVTSSTEVEVHNDVFLPQPRWSMGDSGRPSVCRAEGACPMHRPMINVYVQPNTTLLDATVEGERLDLAANGLAAWPAENQPAEHTELSKKVWSTVLQVPPQETATLRLSYANGEAVRKRDGRSVYRLVVQHQPQVFPETIEISLRLPDGAKDVRAPGFKQRDGRLTLEKPLKRDLVLEVSWRT
jgi:hypothetical protein